MGNRKSPGNNIRISLFLEEIGELLLSWGSGSKHVIDNEIVQEVFGK